MIPTRRSHRRALRGALAGSARRALRGLALPLLLAALTCAGWSAAAPCSAELRGAFPDAAPTERVDGRAALTALRRAVELVEPALPSFAAPTVLPLAADDPAAADARWLAQRDLLPGSWSPDALDAATWNAMLATLLGWYGLEHDPVPAPTDLAGLVAGLDAALARAAEAVRPLALIAWDPERGDELAFAGLVWNWSVYPRLVVQRLERGSTLGSSGGFDGVMARLGSCAIPVERYIAAPIGVATDLYLGAPEARMVLLSSDPARADWPHWVDEGSELAVFRFADPAVRELDAYAAAFAGGSMGPAQLLRMLPRVRTNLGPRTALRYLDTPPR